MIIRPSSDQELLAIVGGILADPMLQIDTRAMLAFLLTRWEMPHCPFKAALALALGAEVGSGIVPQRMNRMLREAEQAGYITRPSGPVPRKGKGPAYSSSSAASRTSPRSARKAWCAMANQIRWYKRDPNAALEGMAVLSLEERGAYNTVLDLIYSHDGKVDDDDRFIAGWCRVDVRVWRRIRAHLLKLGKLYLHGGSLRNERADREVDAALHRVASAAQAGLASAAKRGADLNILKGLVSTGVERSVELPTPTPTKMKTSSSILGRARATVSAKEGLPTKRVSDLSRTELEATFLHRRVQGGAT